MTLRRPTHWFRSGACEHGIGGFNTHTWSAWRWKLPLSLRGRATLNSLEFLVCFLVIAIEAESGDLGRLSCVQSQTDSTTAAGWLHRSKFTDANPFQMKIAHSLAKTLMNHHSVVHSEWIEGNTNVIADCLSRDHHLDDDTLTRYLFTTFPSQMPPNFCICPILPRLVSNVMQWLQALPPAQQPPGQPN